VTKPQKVVAMFADEDTSPIAAEAFEVVEDGWVNHQ
jgi:hypothetical protein